MLMPGLSSARMPIHVRLFFALVLSLMVSPLIEKPEPLERFQTAPAALAFVLASELLIGAMFGFIARIFYSALHFSANAAAMMIGFWLKPYCVSQLRFKQAPKNDSPEEPQYPVAIACWPRSTSKGCLGMECPICLSADATVVNQPTRDASNVDCPQFFKFTIFTISGC